MSANFHTTFFHITSSSSPYIHHTRHTQSQNPFLVTSTVTSTRKTRMTFRPLTHTVCVLRLCKGWNTVHLSVHILSKPYTVCVQTHTVLSLKSHDLSIYRQRALKCISFLAKWHFLIADAIYGHIVIKVQIPPRSLVTTCEYFTDPDNCIADRGPLC